MYAKLIFYKTQNNTLYYKIIYFFALFVIKYETLIECKYNYKIDLHHGRVILLCTKKTSYAKSIYKYIIKTLLIDIHFML